MAALSHLPVAAVPLSASRRPPAHWPLKPFALAALPKRRQASQELLRACTANFVTELHALPDATAFASELPSASDRWSGDDNRGRATLHFDFVERILKHLQSASHALGPTALSGLLQLQMGELARGLPQLHTRFRRQLAAA